MSGQTSGAIQAHIEDEHLTPPVPPPHEMTSTVSNTNCLAIPIKENLLNKLTSGPPETWLPYYIHTAKCDRCGQHNTSVVQRSSRENKQFCKACMYLNVRDGLYSVNVDDLDWDPRGTSVKRRTRTTSQTRMPRQITQPARNPKSAGSSKRKQNLPKAKANKRVRFTKDSGRENGVDSTFLFRTDGAGDEGDETEDDVGFDRVLRGNLLSSEKQAMHTVEINGKARTMQKETSTDETEPDLEYGRRMERERPLYVSNNHTHIQWWERISIPESNVRNEQFNSMNQQESMFLPNVLEAASILLEMREGTR